MTAINLVRLRRGPRWTRQPIPPRLASARAGWYHPGVFATVVPTAAGWTVYEVLGAGMGYADTSFHQRRSYRTLDDAMAAAERRNHVLRRREAEREARLVVEIDEAWPLREGPLPWHPPTRPVVPGRRIDELVRWHLDRCAARVGVGHPVRADDATAQSTTSTS